MKFDEYHPYFYPVIAGVSLVIVIIYWLIWRKNARLANWFVGTAVVALICYLINWDYALRKYFIISTWKLP